MATKLNMTLQLRRDNTFLGTYVLQPGEPGFEISSNILKIGDGVKTWSELPIANKAAIDTLIASAISGHAAGYYTKGEVDGLLNALEQVVNGIRSDLTTEVTDRTNADTALQNQINTKLATETFNTWKGTHESGHAKSASDITAEIAAAVKVEEDARKLADKAITDSIGTVESGKTVVGMISAAETAAKSHAETKASAAYTDAVAEAESKDVARANIAAQNLANAVSTLEGKISTGDSTTLASAKSYVDQEVGKEKSRAEGVESGLNTRLESVEAFFKTTDGKTIDQALDTLVEIQEYLNGEGSATGGIIGRVAQAESDIDSLEGRMDDVESDIVDLGTSKLDASIFNSFNNGTSKSVSAIEADIVSKAGTAKSEAITEAGKLDTALETKLNNKISTDISTAISSEVTRSDAKAKELADAALADAKSDTSDKVATLKSTLEGVYNSAKSDDATIAGAKKYADEKAEAARSSAVSTAAGDATSKANTAEANAKSYADTKKTEAINAAASDATSKANTAEANAKSYADAEIAKEKKRAEEAELGLSGDITTALNTAKSYTDTKVADAHKGSDGKDFVTGTLKDAAHNSKTNPSFITGITVEKGHVTGATVQNLAEVLAAMEFIFDGGTSKNN